MPAGKLERETSPPPPKKPVLDKAKTSMTSISSSQESAPDLLRPRTAPGSSPKSPGHVEHIDNSPSPSSPETVMDYLGSLQEVEEKEPEKDKKCVKFDKPSPPRGLNRTLRRQKRSTDLRKNMLERAKTSVVPDQDSADASELYYCETCGLSDANLTVMRKHIKQFNHKSPAVRIQSGRGDNDSKLNGGDSKDVSPRLALSISNVPGPVQLPPESNSPSNSHNGGGGGGGRSRLTSLLPGKGRSRKRPISPRGRSSGRSPRVRARSKSPAPSRAVPETAHASANGSASAAASPHTKGATLPRARTVDGLGKSLKRAFERVTKGKNSPAPPHSRPIDALASSVSFFFMYI